MPNVVSYHIRPAQQGIFWLKSAYQLFSKAKLIWLSFCVLTVVIELFLFPFIPYLGAPLRLILHPTFLVGFLAAAWQLERGEPLQLETLFAGFRSNLYALIPLGLFNLCFFFLILFASQIIDDGLLWQIAVMGKKVDPATIDSGPTMWAMIAVTIMFIPYLLAFWFAPALIVFDNLNALSALKVSLTAGLANWAAFSTYASIFIGVAIFCSVLASILLTSLVIADVAAPGGNVGILIDLLSYAVAIPLISIAAAAFYTSYRDVFHPDQPVSV